MQRLHVLLKKLWQRHRHRRAGRQSGSIVILTLLAFSAIVGAFLYVSVVGGRSIETLRIRTAADATALAAATVKARTLNYASFVLVAESVILPLADVAQNIATVQDDNYAYAACAGMVLVKNLEGSTQACIDHVLSTAPHSQAEYKVLTDLLAALGSTAEHFDSLGTLWAESVAVQTAQSDAYKSRQRSVDRAAIFPAITTDPSCAKLGISAVSPSTPTGPNNKKACDDQNSWELAYVAMSNDDTLASTDGWHWQLATGEKKCAKVAQPAKAVCDLFDKYPELITAKNSGSAGNALKRAFSEKELNDYFKLRDAYLKQVQTIPAAYTSGPGPLKSCNKTNKVPQLSADWATRTRTIALTMTSNSSDSLFLSRLESMRRGPQSSIPQGSPLGIACAEHYPTDTAKTLSLWSTTWRARLVPCKFTDPSHVRLVTGCGGQSGVLGVQFQRELGYGLAKEWQY